MSTTLKALLLLLLAPWTVGVEVGVNQHTQQATKEEKENSATLMREYDQNKDGKLSMLELQAEFYGNDELVKDEEPEEHAFLEKSFQHADKNGDGHLQEHEIPHFLDHIRNTDL